MYGLFEYTACICLSCKQAQEYMLSHSPLKQKLYKNETKEATDF